MNYGPRTIVADALTQAKVVAGELRKDIPDWNKIAAVLNDKIQLAEIADLFKKDPNFARETYEEIVEEFLQEETVAFLKKNIKIAQIPEENVSQEIPDSQFGSTNYSALDNPADAGHPNVDDIKLAYDPEIVNRAFDLIDQTGFSSLLQNIRWIGQSNSLEHLGVYEDNLMGKGFRISPQRIQNEIGNLSATMEGEVRQIEQELNELQPDDYYQFQLQFGGMDQNFGYDDLDTYMDQNRRDITALVLGEVIVHEATHANGAQDEGQPVENERAFLTKAIKLINAERENSEIKMPNIPLTLK